MHGITGYYDLRPFVIPGRICLTWGTMPQDLSASYPCFPREQQRPSRAFIITENSWESFWILNSLYGSLLDLSPSPQSERTKGFCSEKKRRQKKGVGGTARCSVLSLPAVPPPSDRGYCYIPGRLFRPGPLKETSLSSHRACVNGSVSLYLCL